MNDQEYLKRYTVSSSVDWIHGIKAPNDSVPCKITFKMQAPIYLGHPWINLDSLLTYCVLQDQFGDEIVNLPNKIPIDLGNVDIPVTNTLGVNHTSISFFNDELKVLDQNDFQLDTIYKRFEGKDTDYLKPNKRKGKIRKGSGKFRNFWLRLPYLTPQTVVFYANGNIEGLKYLLDNIHTLGLKRSINAMNIKSVKIKEIETDMSLEHEEKAMRPLPCKKWGAGYNNVNLAYKPPYWDKKNVEMCIFPLSKIVCA